MSNILKHFGSPMIEQGVQGITSTFDLGGIVHSYNGAPLGIVGSTIQFNHPKLIEGDMLSGDMMFANGGTTQKDDFIAGFIEKYKHKLEQKKEYRKGGSVPDDAPSIYVADLAAYNEGRLEGFWLRLTDYDSGAEVAEEIQNFLKKQSEKSGELREEYAIHDYENFPKDLYSEYMTEEDFDKIINAYEVQDSLDIPFDVLLEVQRDYGFDDLSTVKEAFFTETTGDNEDEALGRAYVDIVGFDNIQNKSYYFDYEEYGADLRSDYSDEDDEEGDRYEGISDYDLGEQQIEMTGGIDNISDDLIESYFDYESLGGDLSINDFAAYKGKNKVTYWFSNRYEDGGKLGSKKSESNALKAAKSRVRAMSDDEVFDEIENIFYYDIMDADVSPEELRDDPKEARRQLAMIYAEEMEEDVQPFADGGSVANQFYFYDYDGNAITFRDFEQARLEAKERGIQKFRDNLGGEYFVNYGDGGNIGDTTIPIQVVIDNDFDEPKFFKTFSLAKKFVFQNVKKHDLEIFDAYGDSIFVEKGSSQQELDFLFSDTNFADGGEITDAERKSSKKNTLRLFGK